MIVTYRYFLIVLLFSQCSNANQDRINKIYVFYEPFEMHYRVPTTIKQLERTEYIDTITDINLIRNIISKYNQVLRSSDIKKIKEKPQGVKIICDLYSGEKREGRFYFLGSKVLNNGDYTYEDDLGLLSTVIDVIHSDDLFKQQFEDMRKERMKTKPG